MLVAINGFLGQMGQKVYYEMQKTKDFEFAGGVVKSAGQSIEEKLNARSLSNDKKDKIYDNLFQIKQCDGVIDFSHKNALNNVLNFCLDRHIPLVLATTGFTDNDKQKITFASKYIPIFMASNLSFAMQVLSDIVGFATTKLVGYDIEIVETHHKKKKDAPSGTAVMLAKKIVDTNKCLSTHKSLNDTNKLSIHSLRGGGIVGEHEVLFLGKYDSIKITHTAFSREIFARGALQAMKFLQTKTNGLYSMQDLSSE